MTTLVSRKYSDTERNKTVLVLGRPGTGKSWCLIRNEILQALRRGASLVVFDPKGELYASMSQVCRQMGWDVKVLNCIDSNHSHAWNALLEIFDHDTQMLDADRLYRFADIYITNMFPGQDPDFWKDGAKSVLAALAGLYAFRRERFLIRTFLTAAKAVLENGHGKRTWKEVPEHLRDEDTCTVAEAKKLFRDICTEEGLREADIENVVLETEAKAPEVSLSVVLYDVLMMGEGNMASIRREIRTVPRYHAAWAAFQTFDMGFVEDRVKGSTLQTLGQSLRIFGSEARRRMLSNNDISLWKISSVKSAVFVMADDTDSVKPVLSLFFNFLFEDCQLIWDRTEAECKRRGIRTLDVLHPVSIIMDEAASMGKIPGFPTFLSKARSRHLDVTMTFQNLGQMQDLYGRYGADQLIGNTEYIVYLGCNDLPSAEMISRYCGQTTVLSQSWSESTRLLKGPVGEVRQTETKEELLPVTDAMAFGGERKDHLLVLKTGVKPLELLKFPYTAHPMAKGLRPVTLRQTVKPLDRRFPEEYFRRKDREERNRETAEDEQAVQAYLLRRLKRLLDPDPVYDWDLGSCEDLEAFSLPEGEEAFVELEKGVAEKGTEQDGKDMETPGKQKPHTVVDTTFRAQFGRKARRESASQRPDGTKNKNKAHSSVLEDA
ncbi:MAG: type IV secretory system conjugative DNA transfer family protein [Parasporobacterium sp.]|nr:type IV secretory system conjugative DNA transfer family protein [Parasporobacterium sp.]